MMSTTVKSLPDDAMISHMARTFRTMGDESRLKILRALMGGPITVSRIVDATGQSQANVSKHLSILSRGELVDRRKDGTRVWYSIKDPMVSALCDAVCKHRNGASNGSSDLS